MFCQTRYQKPQQGFCAPARTHSLHLFGEEPARSCCARVFQNTFSSLNIELKIFNTVSFPASTLWLRCGDLEFWLCFFGDSTWNKKKYNQNSSLSIFKTICGDASKRYRVFLACDGGWQFLNKSSVFLGVLF